MKKLTEDELKEFSIENGKVYRKGYSEIKPIKDFRGDIVYKLKGKNYRIINDKLVSNNEYIKSTFKERYKTIYNNKKNKLNAECKSELLSKGFKFLKYNDYVCEDQMINQNGDIATVTTKIRYREKLYSNLGYQTTRIKIYGKLKTIFVHRAVAFTFLENPNGYTEINHINLDKKDNNVNNLEWCDRVINVNHLYIKPKKRKRRIYYEGNYICTTSRNFHKFCKENDLFPITFKKYHELNKPYKGFTYVEIFK